MCANKSPCTFWTPYANKSPLKIAKISWYPQKIIGKASAPLANFVNGTHSLRNFPNFCTPSVNFVNPTHTPRNFQNVLFPFRKLHKHRTVVQTKLCIYILNIKVCSDSFLFAILANPGRYCTVDAPYTKSRVTPQLNISSFILLL